MTFNGAAAKPQAFYDATDSVLGLKDYAVKSAAGSLSGNFAMSSNGDYMIAPALETLRKMVIRILTTMVGEFAHAPTFGAGADEKSLASAVVLQRISEQGKAQIVGLAGVSDALVTVEQRATGIYNVNAYVQTNLGTIQESLSTEGAM